MSKRLDNQNWELLGGVGVIAKRSIKIQKYHNTIHDEQ